MASPRVGLLVPLAILVLSPPACSDDTATTASVTSLYAVPESFAELTERTFFDHPFPSDLRLDQGRVRFNGYYNPRGSPLLAEYISAIDGVLDGYSPVAAGFVRFDGPIDPNSLPVDAGASADAASTVQLIDVDPDSPERGQRRRIFLHWQKEEGVYWLNNTLAFMPAVGFPLRPSTTYALVVTDGVRASDGGPIAAASGLRQVLGLDAASGAAVTYRDQLAPVVAELSSAGIDASSIVHLATYTTDDPTEELLRARDEVYASVPAPTFDASAWTDATSNPTFVEYRGRYGPSPNFQAGTLPFASYGDGGSFMLDETGTPQVVDTFDLRFSLSVPSATACPMPADGYPIVLYAHGTGGSYRSYVVGGVAQALAERCLASMGVDQIFHGTRPGAPSDTTETQLLFFNFQNIEAARTNIRQSGIDEIQRARLFSEAGATVPASVSLTGTEIRFDPNRILFFGHSQGGLNGPVYLAADNTARGGVLSGASSIISITLLEKTSPEPSIAGLVKTIFLGLTLKQADEVNLFHPAISMAQTIVDVVDPINYAPLATVSPPNGFAPKSILMTEGVDPTGFGDTYAPVRGIEALALGYGLPLQQPAVWQPPDAQWGGLEPVTIPPEGLSGNIAGGQASGVLAQWAPPEGEDGHFVVFDVAAAERQAAEFLRNLADDPIGRVPAP